jgi:predicted metal-dependent peptidase
VKRAFEELEAMSVEEIYKLLPKGGGEGGEGVKIERDLNAKCKGGKVLQEGDPEIYGSGQKDEVAEKWKQAVVKAYAQQKLAGKVPEALKRVVDEILQPKVDWRSLLRQAFTDGLGKTVVSTYKRPSRKFPDAYPGIRRFTFPTVHILIDASGSIGEEELTQFVTEVYSLAKMSRVSVRSWDADAYEAIAANTPQQVISKIAQNIRGGGGTMIRPCLRKVLSEMKSKDIVIILTDGEIYDLDEYETELLLSEIASKASVAVFVSTFRKVDIPGWRFVKI